VRGLAWLLLIVTGLVSLVVFVVFLDLVITGLASGVLFRYLAMAEVLVVFLATVFVASRLRRYVRHAST
jgi:hypothetical protein